MNYCRSTVLCTAEPRWQNLTEEKQMKATEILKIDSRGRIVIPRGMRKSLGLKENSFLMIISDLENNELKLVPLATADDRGIIRLRMIIPDEAGSLAKIATVFGELGLSLLFGQTVVIKKGTEAEWSVICPVIDLSVEDLKKTLIDKGGALRVYVETPSQPIK